MHAPYENDISRSLHWSISLKKGTGQFAVENVPDNDQKYKTNNQTYSSLISKGTGHCPYQKYLSNVQCPAWILAPVVIIASDFSEYHLVVWSES